MSIVKVNIHPKFIPDNYMHDIAVLTSAEEFNLEDSIHLPSRSSAPFDAGIVAGFGSLYPVFTNTKIIIIGKCILLNFFQGGPFSGFILYEFVFISNCAEYFMDNIGGTNFCAKNFENSHRGVCKGGSGGGLISPNFEIIGILSTRSMCAGKGNPAIYTDVYSHKLWIEKVLNNSVKKIIFRFILFFSVIISLRI